MRVLHTSTGHANVVFPDLCEGEMVQANQHLIVANGVGMLLDPGGHKVYTKLIAGLAAHLPAHKLAHLLFSHQDPDIVAAANGWLMVSDATAHLSQIWMRFLPHFGIDDLVLRRVRPIPDAGETLDLGGTPLKLIPAHFLHSPGNFQVYDPVARILYTGDLGASIGAPYDEVQDFDAHIQYMSGFHTRYMPSPVVMKRWAAMARGLDLELIAPQHGAMIPRAVVPRFIDWIDSLICGPDTLASNCVVPP
jgi:flavorubredoxin